MHLMNNSSSSATASQNDGGGGGFFGSIFGAGTKAKASAPPKVGQHDIAPALTNRPIGVGNARAAGLPVLPAVPAHLHVFGDSVALSEREKVEINIIKTLIASYFGIVKKNIIDAVPKSIMYFMVNTAKDVLQRECVSQLYKPELFERMLAEADDVKEKRVKCKENLKTLRKAVDILNQVRDHHVSMT